MKKSKLLTRITALLAAVVLLASCFVGCGSDEETAYRKYEDIKSSGKIKVGVSSDNNPFGFADENGEYQGYEIYFANRLAKDMGVKTEYVSTEAENRAKYLDSGKVDVVIADYVVDKTSKKAVDFASPYMKTALAAVCADSNRITSLDKLKKKDRVIVISGSAAASYMTKNYPDISLAEYEDENEAIEALESNKGILWIGNSTDVVAYAEQKEDYSVMDNEIGDALNIAPAVAKGNDTLLKKINKIIKKLNKDEFFKTDYEETLLSVFGKDFESALLVQ